MFQKIVFIFILTIFTLRVNAEDLEFAILSPTSVVAGTYFKVEFKINTNTVSPLKENFTGPNFSDLEVVTGPMRESKYSYTFVKEKEKSSKSITYTYVVVAPKEGVVTIDAATIVIGEKEYRTKPVSIEITKGENKYANKSGDSIKFKIKEGDIILKMDVDKKEAYKGELVIATLKVYVRNQEIISFKCIKEPDFDGFWKKRLMIDDYKIDQDTLNGEVYKTIELMKFLLFPKKAGAISIGVLKADAIVCVPVETLQSQESSVINDFFSFNEKADIAYKVSTQGVKLNIKDLPARAPKEFDGAVGIFTVESDISPTDITLNSSGNIKIKIVGTGNLPLIDAPKILLTSMFDIDSAIVTEKFNTTLKGVSGDKQFNYSFTVQNEGNYKVKPFIFAYFDLISEKYKVIKTQSFDIKVIKED